MRVKNRWVAVLAMALAGGAVGCSDGKGGAKTANVKPGAMPEDGDWRGVYFDMLYGNLHLVPDGNMVKGKWQRPQKGQWGQLTGNIDGNLMRFDWEEYIDGLVGPNSKKKGKGYFVYSRPPGDNVDDTIDGEIGRGEDEVGTEWHAIKQRNIEPDLNSIGGSGSGEVGGGDFDGDNSEDGDIEEPDSPSDDDDDDDDDSKGKGKGKEDPEAPEL